MKNSKNDVAKAAKTSKNTKAVAGGPAKTTAKGKKADMELVVDDNNTISVAEPNVDQVKRQGRPVDPNSERQKRLAMMLEKQVKGELHQGRPVDPESERQKRLAAYQEKVAQGIELKRGRPVDEESDRQKRLADQQAKLEKRNGLRKGAEVKINQKDNAILSKLHNLTVIRLTGDKAVVVDGKDPIEYVIPTSIAHLKTANH